MALHVSQENFGGVPLLGLRLENLSASPTAFGAGHVYYDTTLGAFRFYNGAWKNPLARGDHTGSQAAATISDFAATAQSYSLDLFAIPAANLNINSKRLINLADPTSAQDAATRNYVDALIGNALAGVDAKPSVRIASTANLGLTGLTAIDGVTPVAGDRVLAKDQTTGSANGVYVAAVGAWSRAADADATGEITPGAEWYVEEGTANGGGKFRVVNTGSIALGTTAINIVLTGGSTTYSAATSGGLLLTSTAFSIKLPTTSGLVTDSTGLYLDTTIAVRKYSTNIGDGSATSIVVTHNLGTRDITVSIRDASTYAAVECDWAATTINTATFTFAAAPGAGAYRATLHG